MGEKVTSTSEHSELTLASVDTDRLSTLISLVAHLRAGAAVHARRIKQRLTDDEWYAFQVFVHGPLLPATASRTTRTHLASYLDLVDKADRLQTDAERRKRRRTWFGPELFSKAEHAYDLALVSLERTMLEHPVVLGYLQPRPRFEKPAWRAAPRKWTMPRLGKYTDSQLTRLYSSADSETAAHASDFLDELVDGELRLLERVNQWLEVEDGVAPSVSSRAEPGVVPTNHPSFFRISNE
jgi:hypothetical protein